ncbi:uncharacterized protein PRCAT00002116001 [Priceomyces carsonii]|uniref:uncharacterized protein n=1 Tax=Priceomyces carsonii TaxID=28549 RepID=UPI002EDB2279|nr:unnamed protein product [Priceomyces carsonii]
MTTSPPDTPNLQVKEHGLLFERAASIGWFFIESYYDFYNKNIENIFKIYHSDATVSHTKFPSKDGDEMKTIYKASGIEAIKARFANESDTTKTGNRIVVTSADFEVCLKDKIMISVLGEWSRDHSPYYQFIQTFLLVPGKKENTFDVANDFLRFIDFNDFKEQPKIVKIEQPIEPSANIEAAEPETTTEGTEEKTSEKTAPEKSESLKPTAVEIAIETPVEVSDKNLTEEAALQEPNDKSTETLETKKSADLEKTKNEGETIKKVEQKEAVESNGSKEVPSAIDETEELIHTEDNSKLKTPLSWAALASQAAPVKPVVKVATPPATKLTTIKKANQTSTPSPQQAQQTQQGMKYKKEDWFPIYIRGVKQVDEKHLKSQLIKKFGPIKFFKLNINIAFCDFVTEESQKKALEAKEMAVDDIVIQLEPRESKTNNGNKKSSTSKDQKDKSNGSDSKRSKNEKKPNGKKKTSS